MKKIIADWKKNAKKRSDKNFIFIRSLKLRDSEPVDALAKELHEEAFRKIDCLQCGNCCKHSSPKLIKSDMGRISEHLKISIKEFKNQYLRQDEDGDWFMKTKPCPFLGDENRCSIYEIRPKDCHEFPHTQKKYFASRSYGHSENTELCPAVYYIVEEMKARIQ